MIVYRNTSIDLQINLIIYLALFQQIDNSNHTHNLRLNKFQSAYIRNLIHFESRSQKHRFEMFI